MACCQLFQPLQRVSSRAFSASRTEVSMFAARNYRGEGRPAVSFGTQIRRRLKVFFCGTNLDQLIS